MKNKKKKNINSHDYDIEDYQELRRKNGMKKNNRRTNRHQQKQDLKYYIDNS